MENQKFHQCCGHKKKLLSIFIIIVSIFFIALTVSTVISIKNKIKEGKYIGQDIESRNTINVGGKGEIYAKPDLGIIDLSVITEAKTVEKAMSENTKKMNDVINFVKNQGIEEKDLKTVSFNIYPRYEYRNPESENEIYSYSSSKRRVLIGYEITQQLEVKIRNLEKIGQIIEGATDAGVNDVGDLYFIIDNKEEYKKQARNQAIEKAKVKAEELASQLGIRLVRIVSFSESSYTPYYDYGYGGAMMEAAEIDEAPEIETGENKITSNVSITYEIR